MISCHGLTVTPARRETPLFEESSFDIAEGTWNEFVGPPGAGKSVLRSLIALERRAREGEMVVGGRTVARLENSDLSDLRRKIGCCRQPPEFLEGRTAVENLVAPLLVRGRTEQARRRAEQHLAGVGAEALAERRADRLSEGERWLLGVLRATIDEPPLVVVDGAFDASSGRLSGLIREGLEEVHRGGSTVVIFGRNETERTGDRMVFELESGEIRRATP